MAKFYRLNEHIQASKLRVIGPDGAQLGILTRDEALKKAKDLELDLIEIAQNADPPVARILDFQKFRYEEGKKERSSKRSSSDGGLKELWLSPRIAEHDLRVRINRALEFLKEGYKVKLTVKFRGREMTHRELGYKVLDEAFAILGEHAEAENEPKFEGRSLSVVIIRSRPGAKQQEKPEASQNTQTKI